MQQVDDSALLGRYAADGTDDAFAELVARHINLVYSVALRQSGRADAAEEITQAVFVVLAQKAPKLHGIRVLSSWLFETTRLTAKNFMRSEFRRRRREQEAYMQSVSDQGGDDIWPKIAPILESAVAALNEKDRQAIVLRFYDNRTLREIGGALDTSEAAAEKRVARAVEKLRTYFQKRGIASSATILAETISAHSVYAAPPALEKRIAKTAMARAARASTTAGGLGKTLLLALKSHAVAAFIASLLFVGVGGYSFVHVVHRPPAPGQPPLQIVGVGLYLGRNPSTHKFEVKRVFPNSPADRAGIEPGLIVNKVGDVLAETRNVKQLSQMLAGPAGTKIAVELLDKNGESTVVELVREQFLNRSVVIGQNEQ